MVKVGRLLRLASVIIGVRRERESMCMAETGGRNKQKDKKGFQFLIIMFNHSWLRRRLFNCLIKDTYQNMEIFFVSCLFGVKKVNY